jgi:hypothetical protein
LLTALAVPAALATAETATAAVSEAYTMIEAAPHTMGEAVAEFPVAAIIGSRRAVR